MHVAEIGDRLDELFDACEAGSSERLPLQNAKPNFDLVEQAYRSWGEVKVNLWISSQPKVIFLVRAQVVENYMDLLSFW